MNQVSTSKAPAAIGPYCQGVVHNGLVFTSGQVPLDPATGSVAGDTIEQQSRQVFENISAVLTAAGSGMDKVLKTTCFLSDMGNFAAFNDVYAEYFTQNPARSCVAVRTLPKNVLVEVECVAVVD